MTLEGAVGLGAVAVFILLMLAYAVLGRRWPAVFRSLPPFEHLGQAMERSVEAGERVHLALGTGSLIGPESAPALAGLAVARRIAMVTSMSDRPVIVTAADGAMTLLAQDTLRSAYAQAGAAERYAPTTARLLGPTPFSYVAAMPLLLASEGIAVHLLLGSFGQEGALGVAFGENRQLHVVAGTDDVPSQALLYATSTYPLVGEEVFAGGAYLNVGPMHRASLRAQDAVRWVVLLAILLGTLLRTLGVGL